MKASKLLAFVLALVLAVAPITVFADGEPSKYNMDPAHITFKSQDDVDAIVYRQDGKAPSKETTYELVNGELKLTLTDKGASTGNPNMPDPMLYITLSNLETSINAQDYPYIAIVYRMPKTNSTATNALQLFCCTDGAMPSADTVQPNAGTTADGRYQYAILNPGAFNDTVPVPGLEGTYYQNWTGTVTCLRLDYFIGFPYPVDNGDTIYVRDIMFFADEASAKSGAGAIVTELNLPDEATLSFVIGDHGTAPADQTITKGNLPVRPDDPTAEGFVFDGWYTTKTLKTAFDFTQPLTKEKVFAYAKWVQGYTVTFNCGDDITVVAPATQTVKQNGRATLPDQPERDGYIFKGWFVDAEYSAEYDFSSLVKGNIVLYAKWEEGQVTKYPVTVEGGSSSVAQAAPGAKVTVTANEPAEGMLFDHWEITGTIQFLNEEDQDGTNSSFTFLQGEGATTLKAVFVEAPKFPVTVVNGTANVTEICAGGEVTVTANEAPEGARFDHWAMEGLFEFLNEEDKEGTKPSFTFLQGITGVTFTAIYVDIESGMTLYPITVEGGTASATMAAAGTEVTVTADETEGKTFDHWEITGMIEFMNEEDKEGTKPSFTFRQCEGGASLKAIFVSSVMIGDIDDNGKINAKDVLALMKLIVKGTAAENPAADIDSNGKVNGKDVVALMKQLISK